jgi:hypothetical protein
MPGEENVKTGRQDRRLRSDAAAASVHRRCAERGVEDLLMPG